MEGPLIQGYVILYEEASVLHQAFLKVQRNYSFIVKVREYVAGIRVSHNFLLSIDMSRVFKKIVVFFQVSGIIMSL